MTEGNMILRYDEQNIYVFSIVSGSLDTELAFHHIYQDPTTDSLELVFLDSVLYSGVTERMEAVRHANGIDWWIITHERDNNRFVKLLISEGE